MVSRLKNLRLSGPRQFDAVFSGKKFVTGKLVFFFRPSAGSSGRLGIVAGRKTIPKAVDRNRFKRRMRELRRRYADRLREVDFVVLPRKGRVGSGFRALEACFAKFVRVMEY